MIFYNGSESDPDDTRDQLRIERRVVTLREVPAGEYRAQLIATLRGRAEIGAALQEYMSNSTVIVRVTKSKYANFVRVNIVSVLLFCIRIDCRSDYNIIGANE